MISKSEAKQGTESTAHEDMMFQLTKLYLDKHKLPVNPVNYGLAYQYINGVDQVFKHQFEQLLDEAEKWDQEAAVKLFREYVCNCNEGVLNDLRKELVEIVAQTLGTMIDLTGKTSIANKNIEKHIAALATSSKIEEVMSAVSSIISGTRTLLTETRQFETQLLISSHEVEKLKKELSSAKKEAKIDPLTGIFNRRGFDDALYSMIDQTREGKMTGFCLMLIDIDDFKILNDSHGHLLGDKVLGAVGILLNKHTKGKDICARFGGDEFAVLLPDTVSNNGFNLADNLRMAIEKVALKRPNSTIVLGGFSVSIGVTVYRKGEDSNDILHRCDEALYRAKSLGRNQVSLAE